MKRTLPPTPLTSFLFVVIVAYLMIFKFVTVLTTVGGDPGLGWHLRTGELILTTGMIPRLDPFLFGGEASPWVSNQWLADVLLYLAYSGGSWLGLHIFCFAIAFSAFFLVFGRSALDPSKPVPAQNVAFALAVLCGAVHWITRPVVFSLLGFAIVDAMIRAHRNGRLSSQRFVASTGIVFLLWANLHPAFVLGLVLLGLYAASLVWESYWPASHPRLLGSLRAARMPLLAALVGSLASAVNPWGFSLHLAAAGLGANTFFMSLNTEWLPPSPEGYQFLPFFAAIVLLMVGGVRGGSFFDVSKTILFAVLSFKAGRFVPFFGIAAYPSLVAAVQRVIEDLRLQRFLNQRPVTLAPVKFVAVGLIAASAVVMWFYPAMVAVDLSARHPVLAIRAAFNDLPPTHNHPQVFHTPNWGGAIIWETFPRRVAWIDDRNELNGVEKYKDFLAIERLEPDWKERFDKYGFSRVLTSPSAPLAVHLSSAPEWRQIFRDDRAVVFERNVAG
jgi:hypothetical protein